LFQQKKSFIGQDLGEWNEILSYTFTAKEGKLKLKLIVSAFTAFNEKDLLFATKKKMSFQPILFPNQKRVAFAMNLPQFSAVQTKKHLIREIYASKLRSIKNSKLQRTIIIW
jgi:hypothetical protein